jgi:orotate phosphoribosyltransferase-like protein
MKTLEEIKKEVIDLIAKCPGITEGEIGKELKISYRFGRKLFNQMIENGEICLN